MAKEERRGISQTTREELLKKANFRCVMCGSSGPLELHHIVPISVGGTSDPSNLTVLCANCNRLAASGPLELHFVHYLASLIQQHPSFSRVGLEETVGEGSRVRADIVARRKSDHSTERVIIECKAQSVLA